LLATVFGVQHPHGLGVHVLDRATGGAKPRLVRDSGATYHSETVRDTGFHPDVVIERTGGVGR
jgi:hypothetical protein